MREKKKQRALTQRERADLRKAFELANLACACDSILRFAFKRVDSNGLRKRLNKLRTDLNL
jgi:hypothetical protein